MDKKCLLLHNMLKFWPWWKLVFHPVNGLTRLLGLRNEIRQQSAGNQSPLLCGLTIGLNVGVGEHTLHKEALACSNCVNTVQYISCPCEGHVTNTHFIPMHHPLFWPTSPVMTKTKKESKKRRRNLEMRKQNGTKLMKPYCRHPDCAEVGWCLGRQQSQAIGMACMPSLLAGSEKESGGVPKTISILKSQWKKVRQSWLCPCMHIYQQSQTGIWPYQGAL